MTDYTSVATILYDQDRIEYEDLRDGVQWAQQHSLDLMRVRFHGSANPQWSGRLFQDCDIQGGGSAGFEDTMVDTLRMGGVEGPLVVVWRGESEMIEDALDFADAHPFPVFEYRVDDQSHSIGGNVPTETRQDTDDGYDSPFDEDIVGCLKDIRDVTFAGDDGESLVDELKQKLDEDPDLLAESIESLLLNSSKPEIFELTHEMNGLDKGHREYRFSPPFMSPNDAEIKRGVQYRDVPDGDLPAPPGGWRKADVTFPTFLLDEVKKGVLPMGVLARVLLAACYGGPDGMVESFVDLLQSEEPDLEQWCDEWIEKGQ